MKPITLIITAGTAPAVITEMIYVIHKEQLGHIKEIKVITTAKGQQEALEKLLSFDLASGSFGAYYTLVSELGLSPGDIPFSKESFYVPVNLLGEPLTDIRTREDDLLFASLTNKLVREATANPETLVIACQAGGRKTMGSHLLSAMQVYGRKQDKVYHILVNEPFESCSDFFFPTKESTICTHYNKVQKADAKDAVIDLIDIPFLRLRSYLEESLGDVDFNQEYHEVLNGIERYLNQQTEVAIKRLILDVPSRMVYINKKQAKLGFQLPNKPFAVLLFSAYVKKYLSEYEKVNYELFQDEKMGVQLSFLWHFMYHLVSQSELSDDLFFDTFWYDSIASWKKTKTDLKNKIRAGLNYIDYEIPLEVVDIWINNDSESRTATKTQAWVHIPKERISIIGIDLDRLSKYVESQLTTAHFEQLKKSRLKKQSLTSLYEPETLYNLCIKVVQEMEANVNGK